MTDLRRLPNLVALRAFEAAARHQNFSRAADATQVQAFRRWLLDEIARFKAQTGEGVA